MLLFFVMDGAKRGEQLLITSAIRSVAIAKVDLLIVVFMVVLFILCRLRIDSLYRYVYSKRQCVACLPTLIPSSEQMSPYMVLRG